LCFAIFSLHLARIEYLLEPAFWPAFVQFGSPMVAAFILFCLVGYYLLDSVAKILNVKNLRDEVPPEFVGFYEPHRYLESQRYLRAKTRFELVSTTFDLFCLLLFWGLGGFERLDVWLRSFHQGPVVTGILYFAILAAAREVLALPFDAYSTFVIEEQFGFNRATLKTFVLDRLKGWALAGCLLVGFLAIVLGLLERFGLQIWPVAWLITAAVSILLTYLAPTIILPLFFKFSPLPDGPLREGILTYCHKQNFPIRDLLVIDGSRRSAKANAFFTGFGKNKRIALFDTLIQNHTVPELIAVLAHEVGHFKHRHVIQHFIFAQINLCFLFVLASLCLSRPELYAAFGVTHPSYYVGFALFSLLVQPLTIIIGVVLNFLSRRHEFQADRFAADSTGDPASLILALKKLSKDSLSNLTPHPLLVGLHFTHPPVLQRIRALKNLESGRPTDLAPELAQTSKKSVPEIGRAKQSG
jgi:STE24 endopeptidase